MLHPVTCDFVHALRGQVKFMDGKVNYIYTQSESEVLEKMYINDLGVAVKTLDQFVGIA